MKVLFLAHYFPKPDNPVMGTWALAQAQALARQGTDLQVVSFTAWVPKAIAKTPGSHAYATCPLSHTWPGNVTAHYPRWLYYPVPPLKQPAYRYPTPFLQVAWQLAKRQLIKLIEQFQPDIFFCHHSLPNAWLLAQLPVAYQRPFVVLEHDFDEIADCCRYPRRRAAVSFAVEKAAAWLAVSNRMAQDMQSLFPQINVQVHHNGVNLPPASPKPQPRPLALKGKTVVLTCALFAERKGIPLLIKAFHRIASQHPNAILRIIGSGPEEEKIQRTIQSMAIGDQVQLVGRRPHIEVLQEMLWADCFALTGWDEPFATVYLEAMAAGKPIICCSDGGITDVVQNEVHGLVIPPKDVSATAKALDHMLSSESDRKQWGENAHSLVSSSLTWDTKASELISLFETILKDEAKSLYQGALKTT